MTILGEPRNEGRRGTRIRHRHHPCRRRRRDWLRWVEEEHRGAFASDDPDHHNGDDGAQTRPLTPLDLVNIVGSTPDTPRGADYSADSRTSALTLADLPKGTSEERATVRAFRQAGFKRIYQRSFNGAFNVTDATTYLFGSAAGGARAFAVLERTLAKPGGVSQR